MSPLTIVAITALACAVIGLIIVLNSKNARAEELASFNKKLQAQVVAINKKYYAVVGNGKLLISLFNIKWQALNKCHANLRNVCDNISVGTHEDENAKLEEFYMLLKIIDDVFAAGERVFGEEVYDGNILNQNYETYEQAIKFFGEEKATTTT